MDSKLMRSQLDTYERSLKHLEAGLSRRVEDGYKSVAMAKQARLVRQLLLYEASKQEKERQAL